MAKFEKPFKLKLAIFALVLGFGFNWNGHSATTLISTGSVWRYLANGSNQGTNWVTADFNDSEWSSGPGQLGYGDSDEATVVGFGPDSNNKYITTYFRRSFLVTNAALYRSLNVRVIRDDGIIVYLNGTEVYRTNMPTGPVTYTTLAPANIAAPDESAIYSNNVPSSLLITGTNVIAVEVHQSGGTSADISFDLALIDTATNLPPILSITAPVTGTNLVANTAISIGASASDVDGTVTNVLFLLNTNLLGNATSNGAGAFTFSWSNSPPGYYALRGVARDNVGLSTTSALVNVTLHNPVVRLTAPTNGTGFVSPANVALAASLTDSNAGVTRVDFYSGSNLLGTITNEPWNLTWSNAPAGNYSLTAVAVDTNSLSHTSVFVSISIATNTPPVVSITSPTNNAPFAPGSTIAITASATDNDGTITNVQFTANGTNLGGTTSAPFSFSWANVAVGTYALRAIASDNRGLATTSALITANVIAATVTRGPYLQMNTTNGVIVRWRTSIATGSRVAYGLDSTTLTNFVDSAISTNEHVIAVSNLPPDIKFLYAVGTTAGALAGGDTNYFFAASPVAGSTKDMRIWVLGDSGTAPMGAAAAANQKAVRDSYYNFARSSREADLTLMLGDNAYNSGTDAEYQTGFFDIYPTVIRNTPTWLTLGNHDTDGVTATNSTFPYFDIFSLPQNAEAGGVASGTERYYSFDYANVHFVCLDSQTSPTAANGAMANWLRNDLAANAQPWTIAFWHHPPYTKGSHNSDTEPQETSMRQNFVPILEAYGVDLVLCGHSHVYERSYLINGHYGISSTFSEANKRDAGDGWTNGVYQKTGAEGAIYTVVGASGQTSGFIGTHQAMLRSLNLLSSMVLDISDNRLNATLLGTTSNVLDRFVMVKGDYFTNAPLAPTNITAVITNSTQARLTWANNSTNESGFLIERSTDGVNFAAVGGAFANFTNSLDDGLNASTTYYYRVRATNSAGGAASPIVTVVTPGPPRLVAHPQSQWVNVSSNVTFTVLADGVTPLRYQWYRNSNVIAGATNAALALTNVQDANAGFYFVTVSNTAATSSTNALLKLNHFPVVNAPVFARFWFGGFKARTNVFSASDPDGDPVALALSASSTNGVPINQYGGWFFYRPAPNFTNSDTLSFTFSDPRAAISTGSGAIIVNADTGPPKNLVQSSDGDVQSLNFAGVPGRTYAVQFTDELHPGWQSITNIAADPLGEFTVFDSPPKTVTNRIYRSTVPRP